MKLFKKTRAKQNYSYGEGSFLGASGTGVKTSEVGKRKIPIVFFGTGPVAAQSLKLLAKDFQIEAVVTKPKPPQHRGDFPVLETAEELRLNVHTVTSKQSLSDLIKLKPFTSKLGVLIDFGIIVSQDVIDYFPQGIVNSHFSLLPAWRGADPISFSILSGDKKTGVSLMLIEQSLDTGKILAQKSLPIEPNDTTPTLTEKLIRLSDELLNKYVPEYLDGTVKPRSQPHPNRATYSRKLTKDDGLIDWNKPAVQIERQVRAFAAWPKSTTKLAGKDVIITEVTVVDYKGKPGHPKVLDKSLVVFAANQALRIDNLKPAGKSVMTGQAFLAGYGHLLN